VEKITLAIGGVAAVGVADQTRRLPGSGARGLRTMMWAFCRSCSASNAEMLRAPSLPSPGSVISSSVTASGTRSGVADPTDGPDWRRSNPAVAAPTHA
jgi:hypothetical protein